jgi:hypothetical protein
MSDRPYEAEPSEESESDVDGPIIFDQLGDRMLIASLLPDADDEFLDGTGVAHREYVTFTGSGDTRDESDESDGLDELDDPTILNQGALVDCDWGDINPEMARQIDEKNNMEQKERIRLEAEQLRLFEESKIRVKARERGAILHRRHMNFDSSDESKGGGHWGVKRRARHERAVAQLKARHDARVAKRYRRNKKTAPTRARAVKAALASSGVDTSNLPPATSGTQGLAPLGWGTQLNAALPAGVKRARDDDDDDDDAETERKRHRKEPHETLETEAPVAPQTPMGMRRRYLSPASIRRRSPA